MQTSVETIEPDASARAAATRLHEGGIGSLVVSTADEPVGIVTEADITDLVSAGLNPSETSVESIMSSPLVTVGPDEAIEAAAQTMRAHTIKRLPVVDGAVVGIVTTTDLSNYLPNLIRMGHKEEPDDDRQRTSIRVDTAYEDDDWDFAYLGDESQIDVGDTVRFSKTISEDDVGAFADASGDTNRLHLDDAFAKTTRFGQRIAHGTLVVGTVSAALARLPGLIIYLSQDVSFLGPVPLGQRITAECEVIEHIGNDRFRLSTVVTTAEGDRVIDGEAVVISDEIPAEA